MMSEVQKALLADHAHSDMTEDTHDLLQAFDILLKYIDIDTKMKEKVSFYLIYNIYSVCINLYVHNNIIGYRRTTNIKN